MSSRRLSLISALVILALAATWWLTRPRPVAAPAVVTAAPTMPAAAPIQAAPAPEPISVAAPPAPAPVPEIEATAHMYAAHAPLRVPEVADPDSKTNKQILRTMVAKALAQSAASGSSTHN